MSIMKKVFSTIKIMIFVGVLSTSFTSCEDFMSTDSNRLTLADDNMISSPNDTVYSLLGILNQVQKISDKYVLLGELRGDLMDVTELSDSELRDLSEFRVNPATSSFSNMRDYYAVINNCNYFINRADTNIVAGTSKPYAKEVAVARSIRAWTYMQLVLNYGEAKFFTTPILSYTDTKIDYPVLNQEQMIDALINDLRQVTPHSNIELPGFGSVNGVPSKMLFISTKFLLGDLYLWKASFTKSVTDYEMAALYYAKEIEDNAYINNPYISVNWTSEFFLMYRDNWLDDLSNTNSQGTNEVISTTSLAVNSFAGTTGVVPKLCLEAKLTGSKAFKNIVAAQSYCYYSNPSNLSSYVPTYNPGDLRGKIALASINTLLDEEIEEIIIIQKFLNWNITFYRVGLLYLRYAEAVNRAGKPGLSYAVLKHGLNATNLRDTKKVPGADVSDDKEYVSIFKLDLFAANVGMHDRGSGSSKFNENFVIPDYTRYTETVITDVNGVPLVSLVTGGDSIALLPTKDSNLIKLAKNDSILFVENAICDELALETSFEGNRFQDLIRFSNHRNKNEFLAERVAAKHENYTAFYNLLMDRNNWYIPTNK
jgi:hypothetical protein